MKTQLAYLTRGAGRALLAVVALGLSSAQALAQSFPDKPITLFVGFAPGGAADSVARTVVVAMLPDAPALLSTMTRCPSDLLISSATVRATESAAPPGAKPTKSVIGLSGKLCADACAPDKPSAATASSARPAPHVK